MERLGRDNELMLERYDRHIRLKEIGVEGQMRLRQASVLLIGVGGLGSPIALYLAAAGIGRIGLVDNDVVSLSNLQRQVLYREDEVGESKVSCAARRLLQANSAMQIDVYPHRFEESNAEALIAGYDLVIDACDNFDTRYLIDFWSNKLGKPYVYGSIGEFHGQVSVFNYNGSISYRDLFPEPFTGVMPKGVMGVVPGVIGTLQAAEVIKIITKCGKVLSNRLLTIDLLSLEFDIVDLA